jgi:hypothetical protein
MLFRRPICPNLIWLTSVSKWIVAFVVIFSTCDHQRNLNLFIQLIYSTAWTVLGPCMSHLWIFLFGQERNFTTFFNYYLLLHHFPNISSFIISLYCIYNLFSLHPSYQSKIKRHQFHFISLLAFNKNILWSYFVYHFFKTFQTV